MAETPHVDQDFVSYDPQSKRYTIRQVWFRFLDEINFSKNGAVLPVAHGGTGVTTSTGNGPVVLQSLPTLILPRLDNPRVAGTITFSAQAPPIPLQLNIFGADVTATAVTAVATTIVILGDDPALVFIHDKTSGGNTLLSYDSIGGVNVIFGGIAGIAFTRLAGVGLQAAVTAGANPRTLVPFSICTGTP